MTDKASNSATAYLESALGAPVSEPAKSVAQALAEKYPGAAIFLYGSGISVSSNENPTQILFDFYVIVPDYDQAIANPLEMLAARLLAPNVYYFETQTPYGRLRSKYALLSIEAFRRLAGPETFHSYFWARFAQPSRLVTCPADGESELFRIVCGAIETFLVRSQGLAENPQDWREVWLKGMNASYRAELRAENSDRAAKLIASYGDWPQRTAAFALRADADGKNYGTIIAWKARAVFGAVLSVARLLKATTTFQGGIDYIAWKIKRHSGVDIAVKPWERKHPFIAAPIVAIRYYRLRADASKAVET